MVSVCGTLYCEYKELHVDRKEEHKKETVFTNVLGLAKVIHLCTCIKYLIKTYNKRKQILLCLYVLKPFIKERDQTIHLINITFI